MKNMRHSRPHMRVFWVFVLTLAFNTQWSFINNAQAQNENEAFYIYQNDGHFDGFFYNEVQKISYSNMDTLGIEHGQIVSQEIVTADSVYRIMLSAIDSVGFVQPEVKYNPRLRKVDVVLSGEIYERDKQLYTVPRCDPLTFYISSVSAFVDGTERYKTVVISRNVEANTACNIDFRTGRHDIDEQLGDNAREIAFIKENIRNLLLNDSFELDSVTIAASASPEGSLAANNALTLRRSQAASEYFEKYIPQGDSFPFPPRRGGLAEAGCAGGGGHPSD